MHECWKGITVKNYSSWRPAITVAGETQRKQHLKASQNFFMCIQWFTEHLLALSSVQGLALTALCCSNRANLIKSNTSPNTQGCSKWEKGKSRHQQQRKEEFPNSQELGNCSSVGRYFFLWAELWSEYGEAFGLKECHTELGSSVTTK